MHHRRPAAPHSHRPNHRQINRLMPFTTAPLFHALQLLETGDSARFHMPGHKGEPVFNTYADIFAIDSDRKLYSNTGRNRQRIRVNRNIRRACFNIEVGD